MIYERIKKPMPSITLLVTLHVANQSLKRVKVLHNVHHTALVKLEVGSPWNTHCVGGPEQGRGLSPPTDLF